MKWLGLCQAESRSLELLEAGTQAPSIPFSINMLEVEQREQVAVWGQMSVL